MISPETKDAMAQAIRAYLEASPSPQLAAGELMGQVAGWLAARCGAQTAATLLYGMGDKAVELGGGGRG